MLRALTQVLVNAVGLLVAAKLLPGVHYQGGIVSLLVAGLVIGLVNLLVRPILTVLSCPLIVLTLGLFYLVVNGLMFALAAYLLDDLSVDGFGWAVAGGAVLALMNWLVRALSEERRA
ncbi:MAG TPA: phage holin family protein [Thermoanaerobaculia bacterium]|nr:phage holin family protein [Thermoanaerobaculia bacterium]